MVAGAGNVVIGVTVSGTTTNVTVNNAAIVGLGHAGVAAAIQSAIDGSAVGAGKISVTSGGAGNGALTLTAQDSDVDFTITANSTTAEIGLTVDGTTNRVTTSSSLLDNIGGGGQGSILTVAVNGGSNQQITFGTDGSAGQVSTLAELNTKIGTLTGVTGSASNATFALTVAQATTQTSITINSSLAGLTTALGLTATGGLPNSTGTTNGTAFATTADATRTSLQSDYNNVISQIDALAKDSSYNGINLLYGDNLKVVFNEKGTSSTDHHRRQLQFDRAGPRLDHRHRLPARRQYRHRHQQARHGAEHAAQPGLEVRLQPDDGADPSGLHQEPGQHAADRRRQPGAGRHQRGRREPAGPADPPAALHHRPLACRRRPTRRCCACSANTPNNRICETAGPRPRRFAFVESARQRTDAARVLQGGLFTGH